MNIMKTRLAKKIKSGLRLGAKLGALAGLFALGYKKGKTKISDIQSSVADNEVPVSMPEDFKQARQELQTIIDRPPPQPAPPRPSSNVRKEIDRLQREREQNKPTFRTPEQRQQAIQSTDDFIAKYSKFYNR